MFLLGGRDLHRLLIAGYLVLVFLDFGVEVADSPFTVLNVLGDVFVSFCFCHHILLDTLLEIDVVSGDFLKFMLLLGKFSCNLLVMRSLVVHIAKIEPLTFFFQLLQMLVQIFKFLLVLLLLY